MNDDFLTFSDSRDGRYKQVTQTCVRRWWEPGIMPKHTNNLWIDILRSEDDVRGMRGEAHISAGECSEEWVKYIETGVREESSHSSLWLQIVTLCKHKLQYKPIHQATPSTIYTHFKHLHTFLSSFTRILLQANSECSCLYIRWWQSSHCSENKINSVECLMLGIVSWNH